jgi:uncharacterized protein
MNLPDEPKRPTGSVCRFMASCGLPVSQQQAFAYHDSPGALQRLLPPWQPVTIESSDQSIRTGSKVVLRMKVGPVPLRWVAVHGAYDPPHRFEDDQQSGPFAYWHHEHRFSDNNPEATHSKTSSEANRSVLQDQIEYLPPLGTAGRLVSRHFIQQQLEALFRYRHRVTHDDLLMFDRYRLPTQRVAVSGASGLVGKELCGLLQLGGHQLIRLVRNIDQAYPNDDLRRSAPSTATFQDGATEIKNVAPWDSDDQASRLEGVDTVIHLAGKSIADRRWSTPVKQEIRDSRVTKTYELSRRLASLRHPPKTLLCASAIGIYGDRRDQQLDETSTLGEDFLADVAKQWEAACRPAVEAGIRVVNLRLGIVLSPRGGALAKMLTPTKLGLGGRLGNGHQWWSWIGIDDVIGAIHHAMATTSLSGPVNVVSPHPVTNAEFTKTLAAMLRRPALLPVPAAALRLALGEMADPLLLASARVMPTQLINSQYAFRFQNLRSCLEHLLGRVQRPMT